MSAYLCSAAHISACADIIHKLRTVGYWSGPTIPDTPQDVFSMLLKENITSVQDRYPGDEEMVDESLFHVYEPQDVNVDFIPKHGGTPKTRATATRYYKALDCLEYQSCEHAAWKESDAFKAITEAQRLLSNHIVATHKDYDDAEWGWKETTHA